MKEKKNVITIILIVVVLVGVLFGGYFLCSKKLARYNENVPNNGSSEKVQASATSKAGEVLAFDLGRLVVDTTGEVYFMTRDDTNLGSEKIYTTEVYQTQPNSYEFMGYKLNVSNIRSLYVVKLGNGNSDYFVYLLDKSGNISLIKFTVVDGVINVGEEVKLTQYNDIVSVVPTSSFEGHSALAIDKNGELYTLGTSSSDTLEKVTTTSGEVLEFKFGRLVVDVTGEVYYITGDSTNLGNQNKYTTKVYQTGPDSFEFMGYKLASTNIKAVYDMRRGNGSEDEYVYLIDKSGNLSVIKFSAENGVNNVGEETKLTQYKDIVSVVQTSSFEGYRVLAIDKNGNMYDLD